MVRRKIIFNSIIVTVITFIIISLIPEKKKTNMKYILQWTDPSTEPFIFMGAGQEQFLKRNCPVTNCYITHIRFILRKLTSFDAILFHGPELHRKIIAFPRHRSPHQKYVFVSRESPSYYSLRSKRYNGIFNWTYSYKLSSDIYFGYIIIRNKEGEIIGPRKEMNWLKASEMKPIEDDFKKKLSGKTIAAAWFVSNCKANSLRQDIAFLIQDELSKHNLKLDIYGKCEWEGTKHCPKDEVENRPALRCYQKIEEDYYFYLSFENSLSEDYVTEKLLNAVQHYAVPIVYGGANYTRFLPDGAYLDARKLNVRTLVYKMIEAMNDKEIYYNYFRWTNHYSYHKDEDAPETDYLCNFCRALNDDNFVKQVSTHEDFTKWWNI